MVLYNTCKIRKIRNRRPKHANKTSQVPVKNLSDYDIDTSSFKYGLHHSLIDKNKFIKRDLAVEFKEFHEFLRHATDLLSQNIYHTKDNTFKETHN